MFLLPPERAHRFTISVFRIFLSIPILKNWIRNWFTLNDKSLERELFGLSFQNPVGLAAGFDKDGKYLKSMSALGFGFLELGTVTPKPQTGNPRPRLFRLPKDIALINRMGFNNEGVDALVHRLQKRPLNTDLIIGGNIGKNKTTPNERAKEDYVICFDKLFPYVDYFVVNVSSPNTPNLRALQDKKPLMEILQTLQDLNRQKEHPKPILLKIAPDLNKDQLDDIIEIVEQTEISGLIATNTTISRENLKTDSSQIDKIGNGGLSGHPLRKRSTEVIRYLSTKSQGKLIIIGVGGINSPDDALEKLNAGAALVQIYSGMIYQGPFLIKQINQKLLSNSNPS